jgi:ParB family transcriptional regulator, chromosome partitioning protein
MPRKDSLGRGLGAMFPDLLDKTTEKPTFVLCGIEELIPNRYQARKNFDREEHQSLVASIKKSGIIQPIIVRRTDGGYEIIAGERRWRAAQEAGLKDVPVIIRELKDIETVEISLIENLLRADLNPIEEASGYQTLLEKFNLSHEDISSRVGKDRSTIANSLRLLRLPKEIKEAITQKKLSAGHARTILSLNTEAEQLRLFREILRKGLNVRMAESLVRSTKTASPKKVTRDENVTALEARLSRKLMTRVSIKSRGYRGFIEIKFSSLEELDRLIGVLLA